MAWTTHAALNCHRSPTLGVSGPQTTIRPVAAALSVVALEFMTEIEITNGKSVDNVTEMVFENYHGVPSMLYYWYSSQ
jgi:hypothetical protein